jgi:hypothetical protein
MPGTIVDKITKLQHIETFFSCFIMYRTVLEVFFIIQPQDHHDALEQSAVCCFCSMTALLYPQTHLHFQVGT